MPIYAECAKRWQDTLNPSIDRRRVQRHMRREHMLILRLPVRGAQRRYGQTLTRLSDIVLTVSQSGRQVTQCCRKDGHVLD